MGIGEGGDWKGKKWSGLVRRNGVACVVCVMKSQRFPIKELLLGGPGLRWVSK